MSNLRIGQLAKRAGCTVKAVRFYEAKGLLPPPARSAAGYRLYTDGHLRCLQLIRRAKLHQGKGALPRELCVCATPPKERTDDA